jgi:hypothetical protein
MPVRINEVLGWHLENITAVRIPIQLLMQGWEIVDKDYYLPIMALPGLLVCHSKVLFTR